MLRLLYEKDGALIEKKSGVNALMTNPMNKYIVLCNTTVIRVKHSNIKTLISYYVYLIHYDLMKH